MLLYRSRNLEGVSDDGNGKAAGETTAAPVCCSGRKVNVILFFAFAFLSIDVSFALDSDRYEVS